MLRPNPLAQIPCSLFLSHPATMEDSLRDMAKTCLHRFDARAVAELFGASAAGQRALLKAGREAAVQRRFRRKQQRRRPTGLGEDVVCPITMAPPREPVLLADGHVYERRALDAWLSAHATSPLTREALAPRPYVPWARAQAAALRHAPLDIAAVAR